VLRNDDLLMQAGLTLPPQGTGQVGLGAKTLDLLPLQTQGTAGKRRSRVEPFCCGIFGPWAAPRIKPVFAGRAVDMNFAKEKEKGPPEALNENLRGAWRGSRPGRAIRSRMRCKAKSEDEAAAAVCSSSRLGADASAVRNVNEIRAFPAAFLQVARRRRHVGRRAPSFLAAGWGR